MPTVLHPRALDDVDGSPAHRVVINRNRYNINQDTGLVELESEQEAQELADAYDVTREAIDPGERDPAPMTCSTVKADGEVCGRELPCQYHD